MFNESLGDANEPNPIRVAAVPDKGLVYSLRDCYKQEQERAECLKRDLYEAWRALDEKDERIKGLEAENARLAEDLVEKNIAAATLSLREKALREAVAGYVDTLREVSRIHQEEYTKLRPSDATAALISGGMAEAEGVIAFELNAILKGESNGL